MWTHNKPKLIHKVKKAANLMGNKADLEPKDAWQNEGHWCEASSPNEAHQVCKEWETDCHEGSERHIQAAHYASHEPGLAGGPQLPVCHEGLHILKDWLCKNLQNSHNGSGSSK